MNEIIIAVNKYDCGCTGKRYKSIHEAIANGSYSVWTYERMRGFNEIVDDPVLHFKKHMNTNKQVGITPKRFFEIIEDMENKQKHIDFYNECITQKW